MVFVLGFENSTFFGIDTNRSDDQTFANINSINDGFINNNSHVALFIQVYIPKQKCPEISNKNIYDKHTIIDLNE